MDRGASAVQLTDAFGGRGGIEKVALSVPEQTAAGPEIAVFTTAESHGKIDEVRTKIEGESSLLP